MLNANFGITNMLILTMFGFAILASMLMLINNKKVHKLSFWRGLLSVFCGPDPAVLKLDPNSLSPSAAVPFIYWTVIYVSSYHGSIWEQSRNKASSNSFDTFSSDSSEYSSRLLLLPPVPKKED